MQLKNEFEPIRDWAEKVKLTENNYGNRTHNNA